MIIQLYLDRRNAQILLKRRKIEALVNQMNRLHIGMLICHTWLIRFFHYIYLSKIYITQYEELTGITIIIKYTYNSYFFISALFRLFPVFIQLRLKNYSTHRAQLISLTVGCTLMDTLNLLSQAVLEYV